MTAEDLDARRRDHFIPVRKSEMVAALLAEEKLAAGEARSDFAQLCRLLASIFHYQHFEELERLRDAYHEFNPHSPGNAGPAGEAAYRDLIATLRRVLATANFVEVSQAEIERAALDQALIQVEVKTDLSAYRDVLFFRRGRHRERIERREWMGLRVRHFEVEVYDDVVMVVTMPAAEPAAETTRLRVRRPTHRPGSMIIKCFRDIPSADLNALLPDVRVMMGRRDKWLIGIPALFAGIPLLVKLGPTLAVIAIILGIKLGDSSQVEGDRLQQALIVTSGLLALGSFVGRQWLKYQRQALRYQLEIHGNIYFRNVSNNAGIFDAIIGAAEEQEVKEAMLAYFFLLGEPTDKHSLDHRIETWLARRFGIDIDFELEDGLAKLERLGLVAERAGQLAVPPLAEALARLDRLWDGFFTYNMEPASERRQAQRLAG
jgi:hypothetical protein